MSRKYCEVCRDPHDNGSLGLCNTCADEESRREYDATVAEAQAWREFLQMAEDERWEAVFDFMYARGWRL